jgi:hypothetical protein
MLPFSIQRGIRDNFGLPFLKPSGSERVFFDCALHADFPSFFNNGSLLGNPALIEKPMGMFGPFLR